tara:strand:+ start:134 stop:904 length:771 start_codon:yes stop_codon:yes gene_type:complete
MSKQKIEIPNKKIHANLVDQRDRNKLFVENWFPTRIWFVDLPNAENINSKLMSDIDRWYERDTKGIIRSNSLGWHSAVDMHHRTEYNHFTKVLFKKIEEVMMKESYHPDTEPWCDNMWANINKRYSHNRNHMHPGGMWSGVYYIYAPKDSGRIWFTDPRAEAHMVMPNYSEKRSPHTWREVYYEPVPGRLLIFPSWLMHEVEPNMNKEFDEKDKKGWRYSISFNFGQRFKPGKKLKQRKGHESGGGVFSEDLEGTE